ncbi:nuclease-related domain-containing DEAD/DEAH box helicase [Homoserinimonas sp. A520]
MSAGSSAAQQAQRLSALAQSYRLEAERATADSGRFAAAAIAERRLAKRLSPLTAHGYYLLPDRQWPGSKNAQLDLIVVGPSGVWIVDSKHWNDFEVAAGHMFRGQADVTDEVLRLADVANTAEEAFVAVGLAPGEVRPILVMATRKGRLGEVGPVEVVGEDDVHKHLAARGRRLTTSQVEQVLAVAMQYFPSYSGAQLEASVPVVVEPVLEELPEAVLEDDALLSEAEVNEALTATEMAAPVEDWMTFLHPSQASLVRRSFNGPARIRGSAGTGKTVVGLHRAAYLARMHPHGRVLFTTFVKTLPAVMGNLLTRLAPEAAEHVDFMGVHSFASRVLSERGVRIKIDSRRAGALLKKSWSDLDADARQRLTERGGTAGFEYWKEEVGSVIKGRGFTSFEQYADCARPGRMIRLNIDDRRAVWALFQGYERSLRAESIHDFNDQVLLAEKALQQRPLEGYAAVIVDEAQDLSLSMVRMLHSLVGDGPDAFTLIGDGQQSIYPGGYVLSEAGISLSGRGVVLDRNYRNTLEIQEFAATFVVDNNYTDIDDAALIDLVGARRVQTEPAHDTPVSGRHGPAPASARFATRAEHDRALVAHIKLATDAVGMNVGDIAILCDTNREADTARALLAAASIQSMSLMDYTGVTVDAVKVGTINRAKGLEFKLVMLPWTPSTPRHTDEERAARDLRERYVAATRARDELWVGFC